MRHIISCLFVLAATPFVNCSEPPEQLTESFYLDPAEIATDQSGHETSYKKVDCEKQYRRNHLRKNQYQVPKKAVSHVKVDSGKRKVSIACLIAESTVKMRNHGKNNSHS